MRLSPCQIHQDSLLSAVLMSAVILLLPACSNEGTALTASQAWILEPSAEGISTGGLIVHNRTNEARVLQHIIATDFRQANIRANVGAETGSTPLSPVTVEADQTTELPPDGMMLMLEEPKRPLHVGDKTLLALHFDDGRVVFANAEVVATSPSNSKSDS